MKTLTKLLVVFILIYLFNISLVFSQNRSHLPPQLTTVDTTWVNRFMSNDLPGVIEINDIVTDASGNVYIVGLVRNMLTNDDYITIKYNSDGVEQWSAEFNGLHNSRDVGNGIAVDALGNVYVTGGTHSFNTNRDYATIKYNSAGVQQWVAYYHGPITEASDDAQDIAVDDEGNIYVTGNSESNSGDDFATIKYNNDGEEQWVVRYDGPENESDDSGYFITIDISGNIYVAGRSYDNNERDDYLIVKYNASGEEQWVARYNGPDSRSDIINGIEVDQLGNVYVTRTSSNADNMDYATVMYDSAGVEQWSRRYSNSIKSNDNARALAVNDSGYVYVTGSSSISGADIITIKYSPTGAEEWVKIYNGPSNGKDNPSGITLDEFGNIYVAGNSEGFTLIQYDPAGNEIMNINYPDINSIVTLTRDNSGHFLMLASLRYGDFCKTIKFSEAGIKVWESIKYGPPLSIEQPIAMALDLTGNLYVAGFSLNSQTGSDYSLIKYNSSGDELWTEFYNGPNNRTDMVSAITTDNAGNIYLTGQSGSTANDKDWLTIKYNTEGVEQWAARFLGIADYHAAPEDIVVDTNGNVYVTGYSSKELSFSSIDITTIKYNSAGEEEWVVYYDGPAADRDEARAITLDPSGNIYITGYSKGTDTDNDFVTIRYNPSGIEQWVARYNGDGNSTDESIDIGIDHLNNIVICGSSTGIGTRVDFATVQYNSSGEEQWVQRFNGKANQLDVPSEIAVNENGDVFVTGYTSGTNYNDYMTIKYRIDGVQQWAREYNGPGYNFGNHDQAYALAIGGNGSIYVTGISEGFLGSYDYATLKYNSEGNLEWITRYDFTNDRPVDVVSDGLGNIYVSGYTSFDYGEAMTVTIKYTDQSETSIESEDIILPGTSQLSQNYPNPFNLSTNISWSMQQNSFVTLRVYDTLGQEVAVLVDGFKPAGAHSVSFSAEDMNSGMYLYNLKTNEFSQTRKMLLLK